MSTRSEHAGAAAMIRRELRIRYPHTAFRVTSKCYSGGSSVRVSWTDGPTYADVAAMLNSPEATPGTPRTPCPSALRPSRADAAAPTTPR